jgi:hypothetical protein
MILIEDGRRETETPTRRVLEIMNIMIQRWVFSWVAVLNLKVSSSLTGNTENHPIVKEKQDTQNFESEASFPAGFESPPKK